MNTAPAFLVLLLLVLCAKLQPGRTQAPVVVPKKGVYILSFIADPANSDHLVLVVKVNGLPWATAYGYKNAVSGYDMALPLYAQDKITIDHVSGRLGEKSKVGLTFATDRSDGFKTVWNPYPSYNGGEEVTFKSFLSYENQFFTYKDYVLREFEVAYTGIHWVTLIVACEPEKYAQVSFTLDFFQVNCKDGFTTSASAAFYMRRGTRLGVKYLEGDSELRTEGTAFSFVHLQANNAFTLQGAHSHMAFTAVSYRPHCSAYNLSCNHGMYFPNIVATDYGQMYNSEEDSLAISVSGSYAVAVRGHPLHQSTLPIDLNINGKKCFTFFAERMLQSGQTTFLHLKAGDVLSLTTTNAVEPGPLTMWSVAFVWPEE